MNVKDIGKKVKFSLNTKPEKVIMAASVSTALAILTISDKKKKGKPNFIQRTKKYYNSIDKLLVMTVAKNVAKDEKRKALEKEFSHKKLRDLEIEEPISVDISELQVND